MEDAQARKFNLVFVPEIHPSGVTNERSPKLFEMLSRRHRVIGIPMNRVNRTVYDQKVCKPVRYLLFSYDELLTFWRTLRALRGGKQDVVFAEGSYYSLASGLAAKLMQVPMIWDNHGNIVTFSSIQGKSRLFTSLNVALERFLERISTKILVVSQRDKEDYIRLGFPPGKLEVVPTCVDLRLAEERSLPRGEARRRLGVPEDEAVVLFVGTLRYEPNLEAARYIALELSPAVRKEFPRAKFYVAGSGEVPFAPAEGTAFLGFVDDVYLWLCAADVSIAPLWKGLGILTKVIEAMSAGKPVVVTPLAKDGVPELSDGGNCMIAQDREEFAQKLGQLLTDPAKREALGAEGKRLIERAYSCQVIALKIDGILAQVSASKGSRDME